MPEKKWDLEKLDPGARSALKRDAGVMMGNQLRAMEAFYRAIAYTPKTQEREEQWYACICMECLWKPEDHPTIMPFEEMLRGLYQSSDTSDSIKRRIISLADVPWDRNGYLLGKLCNFVRMLHARDSSKKPDFQALADDLAKWNHPDRYIQRRYIRTICSTEKQESMPENEKSEVNENAD